MFSSALYTPHVGQRGNKLSPRLWARLLERGLSPDGRNIGVELTDDFVSFPNLAATGVGPQGSYAYIEADATVGAIKQVAADPSVINLLTSTDAADGDNHQTSLGTNGNTGSLGSIADAVSDGKMLIFESKFRLPSVTNGDGSVFLGLGEPALGAAATPLADATGHKLADKDLIGFVVSEDDNDALKFQYRKEGQAIQTVATYSEALVADTWYNVGFIYDPLGPASKRIRIFVNNVELADPISQSDIEAATFPADQMLAMYASIIASADADAQNFDLDFWKFFQAA